MPEVEDKQALINVLKRDTGIPFDQTVDIAVLQLVTIATLNLRRTDASRIAFFAPEESFVGNFGEIPQLLEAMGNEVIWLFGQPDRFLDTSPKNGYFIMDDMIRPLKNIDVIVTATVMDCLPPTSKAVLIDHISFAPVEVESLIKSLDKGEIALPHEHQTKEEFFETFTAFIGYLPYYSLILTPSNSVSDISNRSLGLLGYEKTKKHLPKAKAQERVKAKEEAALKAEEDTKVAAEAAKVEVEKPAEEVMAEEAAPKENIASESTEAKTPASEEKPTEETSAENESVEEEPAKEAPAEEEEKKEEEQSKE